MKYKVIASGMLAAGALLLVPAHAQFAKPERAVEYRQSAFAIMGNHMGRTFQAVQGKVPYDREAVIRSAEIVEFTGRLPFEAFGAGTDLMESKAKPVIWKEEAKFKQLASDMQAENVKLVAAAKSGNLDAIRNQFRATVKTCDSCHDTYRDK